MAHSACVQCNKTQMSANKTLAAKTFSLHTSSGNPSYLNGYLIWYTFLEVPYADKGIG